MDYINAFWVGGLICALTQILMEKTKMLPGRIMVLLVCSGAVLGALQIYEPFREYAGAGASVPLLGFGNTLWQGNREIGAGRWLYWDFYGRLHGKRSWDFRSACVRLSGQFDFPA